MALGPNYPLQAFGVTLQLVFFFYFQNISTLSSSCSWRFRHLHWIMISQTDATGRSQDTTDVYKIHLNNVTMILLEALMLHDLSYCKYSNLAYKVYNFEVLFKSKQIRSLFQRCTPWG